MITQQELDGALGLLQKDPHQWSTRPCSTCQIITSLVRAPFGCVLYRMERAGATDLDRYMELLMAVARVFPGETRHQTALRYIREAEARAVSSPVSQA